jgi:hypothetical protein
MSAVPAMAERLKHEDIAKQKDALKVLQFITHGTKDVSLLSKHLLPVLEEASKDAELRQQAAYLMKQIKARRKSEEKNRPDNRPSPPGVQAKQTHTKPSVP